MCAFSAVSSFLARRELLASGISSAAVQLTNAAPGYYFYTFAHFSHYCRSSRSQIPSSALSSSLARSRYRPTASALDTSRQCLQPPATDPMCINRAFYVVEGCLCVRVHAVGESSTVTWPAPQWGRPATEERAHEFPTEVQWANSEHENYLADSACITATVEAADAVPATWRPVPESHWFLQGMRMLVIIPGIVPM